MTWTLSAFADEAGGTAQEQIDALQAAGIKYIDLRGIDGCSITELPLDQAAAINVKLADAGIGVQMFGSPIGKIDIADAVEIDLDKLKHLGDLKDVFNCNAVRVFSYFNKAAQPVAQWRQESLSRLSRLRDLAVDLGLVLYHENERHIFGDRLPGVKVIADELRGGSGDGPFRIIFDFDNFNQTGDDVWRNWLELRDQTDGFHVKDSDPNNQHVPAGRGAGKIREILGDALDRGWQGPLTLEPHLAHSAAVLATGPHGVANQSLAELGNVECFQLAAEAATALLDEINAPVA